SIDGKLTDKYRKSQWITDEYLRQFSHSFRGEFSAILTEDRTIIDDNPLLTLREEGWNNKKLTRVILDSQNRLDTQLKIFKHQESFPIFIFSSKKAKNQEPKVKNHFFVSPAETGGLDLAEVLEVLYKSGIASIMIEGGGRVFDSFLKTGLYDEIVFSTADKIIGGESSVQFFASGTPLADPVILKEREIIPLETGYIVRGVK
ncbi:MAG: RibD family protein, partial [bacterium]|nr:RibD family protein [bacterium]